MVECKVCSNVYHDARTHCQVCGAQNWETYHLNQFIRIAPAINAMPVKQNLYDGKILGLRIR